MKAVVYTQYGSPDVLRVQEVAKPVPNDNEVLIRVRTTSVNFGDLIARNFGNVSPRDFHMPFPIWLFARTAFGFWKPRNPILGSEFAGQVEAVGKDVKRFKVGDAVFGFRAESQGANVEYLVMPENGLLAHKPANLSYEEAAVIPGGTLTAMGLLRKANIQPGQKVLINGASGSIGAGALQLAKYYGAHVTGVCGTARMEMVRALGADKVIDYSREDFTQNGETYDLIFDVLGKTSFARCKGSLKPDGRNLLVSFKMKQVFQMLWTSRFSRKKVICALSGGSLEDLLTIKALAEAGHIKGVVDRCYPLEAAADAHRYVESGSRTGNVVLTHA